MRGDPRVPGTEEGWTAVAHTFWRYRRGRNQGKVNKVIHGGVGHERWPSFTAETKRFEVRNAGGRKGFRLVETSRYLLFAIEVDREDLSWMVTTVRSALEASRDGSFKRTNRRDHYVVVVETYANNRGVVLKVSKFVKGRCFFILIPEGPRGKSWEDFRRCMGQAMEEEAGVNTGDPVMQERSRGKPWEDFPRSVG